MSSVPEDGIALVLAELRALATQTDGVKAHLEAIDAKLAAMPSSAEVDELRLIVTELQSDVQKIKDFVEGDPPLQDRLIRLEENVAEYKLETNRRERDAASVAGTATDMAHRGMARSEAAPLIEASEARSGREIRTLTEAVRSNTLRIEKLWDVALENRWVSVAGVLLASALLYVLVQVIPW